MRFLLGKLTIPRVRWFFMRWGRFPGSQKQESENQTILLAKSSSINPRMSPPKVILLYFLIPHILKFKYNISKLLFNGLAHAVPMALAVHALFESNTLSSTQNPQIEMIYSCATTPYIVSQNVPFSPHLALEKTAFHVQIKLIYRRHLQILLHLCAPLLFVTAHGHILY